VVVEEAGVEWRLAELVIQESSPFAHQTLAQADIRNRTGALVLALRKDGDGFITNPSRDEVLTPGTVLIAMGTPRQLEQFDRAERA
jgi:voltage-gated potassium channel